MNAACRVLLGLLLLPLFAVVVAICLIDLVHDAYLRIMPTEEE